MNNYLHHVVMTRLKFGERGSCPIDQTPSQSFNRDPHTGRPMSDIQRLVHIQNDLQLASEFAQLQEHKSSSLPADISNADALKFACPRLCQLPSELLEYRVKLAGLKFDEKQQALDKKAAEDSLKRQQALFDRFINDSSKIEKE